MNRALAAAGIGAVVVGLVTVAIGGPIADLASSRLPVSLVAVAAIVLGLWYLVDRRVREVERAEPPDRERGSRVPTPGERIDAALDRGESLGTIKRRLAERVSVSLRSQGLSREDADAAVERGSWTDDRVAAAFLASGVRSVPLAARLRWMLRGDSPVERCVDRTVGALAELREGARRE